jgi:hypothetical protein
LDLRDEETQIIPTARRTFRQAYNAEVGINMGDLLTLEGLAFQRPDNRSNLPRRIREHYRLAKILIVSSLWRLFSEERYPLKVPGFAQVCPLVDRTDLRLKALRISEKRYRLSRFMNQRFLFGGWKEKLKSNSPISQKLQVRQSPSSGYFYYTYYLYLIY